VFDRRGDDVPPMRYSAVQAVAVVKFGFRMQVVLGKRRLSAHYRCIGLGKLWIAPPSEPQMTSALGYRQRSAQFVQNSSFVLTPILRIVKIAGIELPNAKPHLALVK
jgi:hypothetical protein